MIGVRLAKPLGISFEAWRRQRQHAKADLKNVLNLNQGYQRKFHGGNSGLRKEKIFTKQTSLRPVGTSVKRSLGHILHGPKIIVSNWHLH